MPTKNKSRIFFVIILTIILSSVISFGLPGTAKAVNLNWSLEDLAGRAVSSAFSCSKLNILSYVSITCMLSRLGYVIGIISGFFIMIVMIILEYALYLNSQIYSLPAVQIGWNFTRDVANMGFVLGIIVIAFATILRSQSYGVKQLIVRLIIAAVFVNLSLSIAGVFLDLAGVPSQFFIDKISGGVGGPFAMGNTLAAAFNIQNIEAINNKDGGVLSNFGISLGSVFFSLIFSIITLITLIALAGMFLYRFIVLAILIILMPLAILTWVFPAIRGQWGKWTSKFIQWTFFAPLSLFFLYLAIYTVKVQGNYITVAANALKDPTGPGAALVRTIGVGTGDPMLLMANMVLMILLTLGGLFAAQSMGIAGASAAMGILREPAYYAGRAARRRSLAFGERTDDATGKTTTTVQRRLTGLASVPGFGRIARVLEKATIAPQKASVDAYRKEFAKSSFDILEAEAKNISKFKPTLINNERAAALLMHLAENNRLKNLKDVEVKKLISASGGTSADVGRSVAKFTPAYYKELGMSAEEAAKQLSPEGYPNIPKELWEDKEFASAMATRGNVAGFRMVADKGSPELIAAATKGIEESVREFSANVKDFKKKGIDINKLADKIKSKTASESEKNQYNDYQKANTNNQRSEGIKNFVYNNSIYQGFADPVELAKYREEVRAKKKGTKKTTTKPTSDENADYTTQ